MARARGYRPAFLITSVSAGRLPCGGSRSGIRFANGCNDSSRAPHLQAQMTSLKVTGNRPSSTPPTRRRLAPFQQAGARPARCAVAEVAVGANTGALRPNRERMLRDPARRLRFPRAAPARPDTTTGDRLRRSRDAARAQHDVWTPVLADHFGILFKKEPGLSVARRPVIKREN